MKIVLIEYEIIRKTDNKIYYFEVSRWIQTDDFINAMFLFMNEWKNRGLIINKITQTHEEYTALSLWDFLKALTKIVLVLFLHFSGALSLNLYVRP